VDTLGRFPFLFVLGVLGTPVVAAFAIGSRVVRLAMIPSWGYATAASALVGQHLGAEDEGNATRYGWDSLRVSLATQLLVAGVVAVLARPVVELFNTDTVGLSVQFVWVFALGIAANATFRTLQGALRGAGDTSWPLYGTLLGTGFRLVLSALALPAAYQIGVGGLQVAPGVGLGLVGAFLAILVDWHARAVVNAVRFRSGAWRAVARRSAERAEASD
jgi:Na+-driven multidrug efflux pump